ncbi:unnamed protein product [Prorocentrum cordatum]|uniref:FAD-binding FR-type domain-containing protein n=1 Tax=Prorocentrum cordatum TaxID=2364126 RepID=A0ABN9Y7Y7_9DINO|nr:unnamed protein product [Polarella glacialis]
MNACEILGLFVRRRVVDICLLVGAVSGCLIVLEDNISQMTPRNAILAHALIFLWPLVLLVLVLQTMFKFQAFVREVVGMCSPKLAKCFSLGSNQWSEPLQRSWWEIAYFCHVAGYSLLVVGALTMRLTVFWPTLFTWGYDVMTDFYDRIMIMKCARNNTTPIVVDVGSIQSSYTINKGEGATAEPSHVRLVLKKPPGFQYKAGQWCQLALPQCGSYLKAPAFAKPLLQWHAFSIASAEQDDFLEFHIAVHGSPHLLADATDVALAPKSECVATISEKGNCFESMFPHAVPHAGEVTRGNRRVERSGVYLNLTGEDGGKTKLLRPQLQWTGRMWNVVQWLLECRASHKEVSQDQVEVSIMGPYGTMPHTVAAHKAVMLIGAGVGFPSTGAMLRQLLQDNLEKQADEQTAVCFLWTATKVDQMLLCFPSLIADLTRYVNKRSIAELKSWLTVKIFISSFEAGDFLDVNPGDALFPESTQMQSALTKVRNWLLGHAGVKDDEDGTYVCQGSLGASFADVLRKSAFVRDRVVKRQSSLGVCFCGPGSLGNWIRRATSRTRSSPSRWSTAPSVPATRRDCGQFSVSQATGSAGLVWGDTALAARDAGCRSEVAPPAELPREG